MFVIVNNNKHVIRRGATYGALPDGDNNKILTTKPKIAIQNCQAVGDLYPQTRVSSLQDSSVWLKEIKFRIYDIGL